MSTGKCQSFTVGQMAVNCKLILVWQSITKLLPSMGWSPDKSDLQIPDFHGWGWGGCNPYPYDQERKVRRETTNYCYYFCPFWSFIEPFRKISKMCHLLFQKLMGKFAARVVQTPRVWDVCLSPLVLTLPPPLENLGSASDHWSWLHSDNIYSDSNDYNSSLTEIPTFIVGHNGVCH